MKRPDSRAWYGAVATAFFLAADHVQLFTRLFSRHWLPWLELGLRDLLQVFVCFSGISVAHGFGGARVARELGLRAPIGRAFAFALLASAPMLVVFALNSSVNPQLTFLSVAVGCGIAPFAEEILFRAYIFRQLYRRARAGFWLSALIPSVLFALGHVYQARAAGELIGILSVTGLGSLLGCWLFLRWQDNLWAVFGLHSLMNLWWEVFAVDETALGGWQANLARAATIVLAVVLTLFKDRLWSRLPIENMSTRLETSCRPRSPTLWRGLWVDSANVAVRTS
jgi:uncharacterized protein